MIAYANPSSSLLFTFTSLSPVSPAPLDLMSPSLASLFAEQERRSEWGGGACSHGTGTLGGSIEERRQFIQLIRNHDASAEGAREGE